MKKVDIISNIVARKGEALATPSKDISKVNLSGYLLKSIWDKVFEIRTDSQGTEYIFGKIPVVTQYGITMYSGDGVDIPSLASGLPFDGRTIWYNPDTQQIEVIGGTGGGSGEGVSNFWDLSGIPSWITNSKPKYSYSEIEGTPDLSVYAQVDTLKAYVTLAGAQTLTGEKNFTGGLKVNGSPIIYDSANKYWKLQGNLVLTGGITMYADDGTLNLPSIYDGLPIDGTTIYWDTDAAGNRVLKAVGGGGTADSVAWNNITGKPSWIGSSKPTYSYSEIQGTPDLSVYALKTQIPSLSGYATESWVTKQNYATKATTLSGYGITDAYTKTNVDDLLKAYVTLSGEQTISGKKNFTGGLKVNGSPIYYDTEKKYWKLEGDLLVTGGITMYGNEGTYTPSTIMDAIAVDGTTISKSGGVLKVIGGTGGGVADSVAWANITGKPTFASVATSGKYSDLSGTPSSLPASDVYSWAKAANKPSYTWSEITSKPTWIGSSKPIYSYSEITGAISTTELQNYLTSNSYLNVTSGDNRYLQLSGGTISNNGYALILNREFESPVWIQFRTQNEFVGAIGGENGALRFMDKNSKVNTVWHSGNFTPSDYLPLSGGTLTGNYYSLTLKSSNQHSSVIKFENTNGVLGYMGLDAGGNPALYDENLSNGKSLWHSGNDGSGSGLDADSLDGYHANSSGNKSWGTIPVVNSSGWMEVGKQLEFHYDNTTNSDYSTLLKCTGNYSNVVDLPSSSGTIALTTDNVSSATKLQTARTIWGQSFDGTGNIDGLIDIITAKQTTSTISSGSCAIRLGSNGSGHEGYHAGIAFSALRYNVYTNHIHAWIGLGSFTTTSVAECYPLIFATNSNTETNTSPIEKMRITPDGNVGIGTTSPERNLVVSNNGAEGLELSWDSTYGSILTYNRSTKQFLPFSISASVVNIGVTGVTCNLLVTGGITMYSDQRKKTILNHVELSLKQIANAPLIEHYYNSDKKKITHVGSIAQYWYGLNDWFCKEDSEGYLTMEIQNAALASAISIARELDRYETKTGKAIKKLKKRICELEEEVERLKSA